MRNFYRDRFSKITAVFKLYDFEICPILLVITLLLYIRDHCLLVVTFCPGYILTSESRIFKVVAII